MAPTQKAAKLTSLSSFKLVGKMWEDKIRKDEKRKHQVMMLMKVAQEKKNASFGCFVINTFFGKSDHFVDPTTTNLPLFAANTGWCDMVWTEYSDAIFTGTLRVSRGTFVNILNQITQEVERKSEREAPAS